MTFIKILTIGTTTQHNITDNTVRYHLTGLVAIESILNGIRIISRNSIAFAILFICSITWALGYSLWPQIFFGQLEVAKNQVRLIATETPILKSVASLRCLLYVLLCSACVLTLGPWLVFYLLPGFLHIAVHVSGQQLLLWIPVHDVFSVPKSSQNGVIPIDRCTDPFTAF